MGKKTELHEAAERGESEELQRLLDTGYYDVNEGAEDCFNVCEEGERETYDVNEGDDGDGDEDELDVCDERERERERGVD
jgi:hypothetical protein